MWRFQCISTICVLCTIINEEFVLESPVYIVHCYLNKFTSDVIVRDHMKLGAGSLVAIAWAIADDILPFHYLVYSPDKTNQSAK